MCHLEHQIGIANAKQCKSSLLAQQRTCAVLSAVGLFSLLREAKQIFSFYIEIWWCLTNSFGLNLKACSTWNDSDARLSSLFFCFLLFLCLFPSPPLSVSSFSSSSCFLSSCISSKIPCLPVSVFLVALSLWSDSDFDSFWWLMDNTPKKMRTEQSWA